MSRSTVVFSNGPPAVCGCGRTFRSAAVSGNDRRGGKSRVCPQCTKDEKKAKRRKKLEDTA